MATFATKWRLLSVSGKICL